MALNLLGLGMVFEATDHASHVIHELEEKVEHLAHETGVHVGGMEHAFKNLGTGLAASLIAFEGLEKTFELAEAAAHGEQALLELKSTTHLTATELEHLEKAAIEATNHTKFEDDVGIKNLHALMRQGYDAKEAIDLLRPSLLLASDSMGQLTPEAAGEGLAKTMRSYGIETKYAGLAVDQMVKGINDLGMDAGTLPDALRLADRGARAMNQSMTEVLMTAGLAKDVFGSQTRAAANLGREMAGMANPKTQHELAALGKGVSVFDRAGDFRPFLDVVADIGQELTKMSAPQRQEWLEKTFGEAPVVGVLIDELNKRVKDSEGNLLKGAAAANHLRESFRNVGDVAEHTNHVLESGFHGSLEQMEKLDHEIEKELGAGFRDAFKPLIDIGVRAMQKFLDILRTVPGPVKTVAAGVIVAGLGLLGLTGALMVLTTAWPLLVIAWGMGTASLGAFATAAWLAIAPMVPWIVGIGLVAAAVYAVHENIGGLGDAWEWLKSLWDVPLLKGAALAVLGMAGAIFILGNSLAITEAIEAVTMAVWGFTAALLANPLTWIIVGLVAIGALLWAIKTNWKGLGEDFSNGIDMINAKLAKWFAWFKPIAKAMGEMWDAANAFWGGDTKKQPSPAETAKGADDLETDIYKLTKTERGMGGAVIGTGEYAKKAEPNVHDPGSHAEGVDALHDGGAMGEEQMKQMLAQAAQGTQEHSAIDYDKLSAAVSGQPIHNIMEVDGEKMAEVVNKVQRGHSARSMHDVGPQ